MKKNISLLLFAATLVFAGCVKEEMKKISAATVPASISFNLPSGVVRLVYTDPTGASVLPMLAGESLTVEYTLKPDDATFKDVVWSSSNESAATVDQGGKITAVSGKGLGYSIIQVAPEGLYSGSGVNATLKVMVYDAIKKTSAIRVSAVTSEVYDGDSLQITGTVTPSDATYRTFEWSVDDAALATIGMNGVLKALTPPNAHDSVTVTAKAIDGSGVYGSMRVCIRKIVEPTDVTIDQTCAASVGYACAYNEKTLALSYTTVPAESTISKIVWSSSDNTLATVDQNGVVSFNLEGNFGTVTITATCPNGNAGSIDLNISAGHMRELFHNALWQSWKAGSNATTAWYDGYLSITTSDMGNGKHRADFKSALGHNYIHAGNYPLFAMRVDNVCDNGAGATKLVVKFDMVGKSGDTEYRDFVGGVSANQFYRDIPCYDVSGKLRGHVYVYDFASQKFNKGGLLPTDAVTDFTIFQIKYVDIEGLTVPANYKLYWVQTFKTLEDINDYIESEGLSSSASVDPTGVEVDQSYASDKYDFAGTDGSIQLSASVLPEKATQAVQWSSSDESIATVSADGLVTFNTNSRFGKVTITATAAGTDVKGSVELNLGAGKLRETFHNEARQTWKVGTKNTSTWYDGRLAMTTYVSGTKYRVDFMSAAATTYLGGEFPIFAFRADDLLDNGAGASVRNIKPDLYSKVGDTEYRDFAGNGNNTYVKNYACKKDGIPAGHVFVYDFGVQTFKNGLLLPTDSAVPFSICQVKYADIAGLSDNTTLNLYWVQTFRSIEELQAYIASEGLTYSE